VYKILTQNPRSKPHKLFNTVNICTIHNTCQGGKETDQRSWQFQIWLGSKRVTISLLLHSAFWVYTPPCTENNAYTNTRYAAISL